MHARDSVWRGEDPNTAPLRRSRYRPASRLRAALVLRAEVLNTQLLLGFQRSSSTLAGDNRIDAVAVQRHGGPSRREV
jgi:hypothetical protein